MEMFQLSVFDVMVGVSIVQAIAIFLLAATQKRLERRLKMLAQVLSYHRIATEKLAHSQQLPEHGSLRQG